MASFQWDTMALYLTYSQCSLPKEEAFSQINEILEWHEIDQYLIAEEKHENGGDHLHVYLKLKYRLRSRNSRLLDLVGIEGEAYHPNVETRLRSAARVMRYCTKDGNFIGNIHVEVKLNPWTQMIETAEKGDMKAARAIARAKLPRESIVCATAISTALTAAVRQAPRDLSSLSLDHFSGLEDLVWDQSKTLIIQGAAGLGKTNLAKLMIPGALFCSHVDTLKSFQIGVHTGIIFDDLEFKHLPRSTQIHICDYEDDRDIHCRHYNAFIPAKTPKIITTNLKHYDVLLTDDPAIDRRTVVWVMEKIENLIVVRNL